MTFDLTQFVARDRMNDRLIREVLYTGPVSYTTGGEDLEASEELGLGEIYGVYGTLSDGTRIVTPWWNYVTQRLLIIDVGGAAQVGSGADLSAFSGVLLITGKG